MRILVLLGHPRADSLCGALAAAYAQGAREAGCEVAEVRLSELSFCPDVVTHSPADQPIEADLERAKDRIEWADHLVLTYPNWWGTMPALLKGFLDRVLLPGFAFREQDGHYYGLLHGRTAELLTTLDVLPAVYRWIQGEPGIRALARATLGLCGIETVRVTTFARSDHSDLATRRSWIERARALGHRLAHGPRSRRQRMAHAFRTWLWAVRPQFYPMSILAYTAGAMTGAAEIALVPFVLGLVCMVALKAATVLTNDIYDRESDARNLRWSPFTGGGRGLQERGLGLEAYWRAVRIALGVSAASGALLLFATASPGLVLAVLLPLGVVALGYTIPPLELSHRGLGELDVALTHGPGVVLLGHVAQGGSLGDPLPWLLGLLIALAVSPAIILSGIPDRGADRAAGKRTLAVSLGAAGATRLAFLLLLISAFSTVASAVGAPAWSAAAVLPWIALPHAIVLSVLLRRYLRAGAPERRIDALMAVALLYIGWFVIVPVIHPA